MWLFALVPLSGFIAVFSCSHLSNAVTPKLSQNRQKIGTPNLWKVFGSKDFWNPNEKVWYIDISFTLESGWKNERVCTWSKLRFYCMNRSLKTVCESTVAKRKKAPQKPGWCKAGEKRNMNNWQQQLLGSRNNQQPVWGPKSLIMCKHSS